MRDVRLIVHDIRSTHNIGALLRTAEGLGVKHLYFTGYTPYPKTDNDQRLPHISNKLTKQIHKTALGAETADFWSHEPDIMALIQDLKDQGFEVIALEQASKSTPLPRFEPTTKTAILLGREVEGISPALIKRCDEVVEIPMKGKKESFNVVEAASMAMYHCLLANA